MSFFSETMAIPFWIIIFIFASAIPLWLKLSKRLIKKITSRIFLVKKIFSRKKTADEIKNEVLKKASEHMNENAGTSGLSQGKTKKRKRNTSEADVIKKKNIRDVLAVLAEAGEAGILPQSLSDKAKINSLDTKGALTYLTGKKYAEVINSTNGTKYYLTDLGRRYCINKRYIS